MEFVIWYRWHLCISKKGSYVKFWCQNVIEKNVIEKNKATIYVEKLYVNISLMLGLRRTPKLETIFKKLWLLKNSLKNVYMLVWATV